MTWLKFKYGTPEKQYNVTTIMPPYSVLSPYPPFFYLFIHWTWPQFEEFIHVIMKFMHALLVPMHKVKEHAQGFFKF
jgi:hypothetical protein